MKVYLPIMRAENSLRTEANAKNMIKNSASLTVNVLGIQHINEIKKLISRINGLRKKVICASLFSENMDDYFDFVKSVDNNFYFWLLNFNILKYLYNESIDRYCEKIILATGDNKYVHNFRNIYKKQFVNQESFSKELSYFMSTSIDVLQRVFSIEFLNEMHEIHDKNTMYHTDSSLIEEEKDGIYYYKGFNTLKYLNHIKSIIRDIMFFREYSIKDIKSYNDIYLNPEFKLGDSEYRISNIISNNAPYDEINIKEKIIRILKHWETEPNKEILHEYSSYDTHRNPYNYCTSYYGNSRFVLNDIKKRLELNGNLTDFNTNFSSISSISGAIDINKYSYFPMFYRHSFRNPSYLNSNRLVSFLFFISVNSNIGYIEKKQTDFINQLDYPHRIQMPSAHLERFRGYTRQGGIITYEKQYTFIRDGETYYIYRKI